MALEYWVKNISRSDLVSSELGLRIPAGQIANLGKLNPALTHEAFQRSEVDGFLSRCYAGNKLIKIPFAPSKQTSTQPLLSVSNTPIPSRVSTSIVMKPDEVDFIEELSHFDEDGSIDRYSEGFADPIIVEGEEKMPFGDGVAFKAIVSTVHQEDSMSPKEHKAHTKTSSISSNGHKQIITQVVDE